MDMDSVTPKHTLIASDRVEGKTIARLNGEKIGTIQRLMVDKFSGNVAYAVVKFGGFLGLGQKHLPIQWNRLQYDPIRAAYLVDISEDELKHAYDEDEDFDWGDRPAMPSLGARPYPHSWGAY